MPTRVYLGYKEPDRKLVKRIVVGVTILSNRPTLGRILKELRRHRNWTLREMSERSGIPVSTLSKVENDRLTLTYDKLAQLSEHHEIPISER
jgi:predicted transcriptional regulator